MVATNSSLSSSTRRKLAAPVSPIEFEGYRQRAVQLGAQESLHGAQPLLPLRRCLGVAVARPALRIVPKAIARPSASRLVAITTSISVKPLTRRGARPSRRRPRPKSPPAARAGAAW